MGQMQEQKGRSRSDRASSEEATEKRHHLHLKAGNPEIRRSIAPRGKDHRYLSTETACPCEQSPDSAALAPLRNTVQHRLPTHAKDGRPRLK